MKKFFISLLIINLFDFDVKAQSSELKHIITIEVFMVNPYESHGFFSFTQKNIEAVVTNGLKDDKNSNDYFYSTVKKKKVFNQLKKFSNYTGEKCKDQPVVSKTMVSVLIKYTFSDSTQYLLGVSEYYTYKIVDCNNNIVYKCNADLISLLKKITPRKFKKNRKESFKTNNCEC